MSLEYYIPTEKELLSKVMNGEFIYVNIYSDGREEWSPILFDINMGIANALNTFITSSDYDTEKGFSINTDMYRLKS